MTRTTEEIQSQAEFLASSGAEAIAKVIASYEERLAGSRRQIDIESEQVANLNAEVRRLNTQIFDLLRTLQDSH